MSYVPDDAGYPRCPICGDGLLVSVEAGYEYNELQAWCPTCDDMVSVDDVVLVPVVEVSVTREPGSSHFKISNVREVPVEVPVSRSTAHSGGAIERTSDHLTPPDTTDVRDS